MKNINDGNETRAWTQSVAVGTASESLDPCENEIRLGEEVDIVQDEPEKCGG